MKSFDEIKLTRRDFVKKSVQVSLAGGWLMAGGGFPLLSQNRDGSALPYELVALANGEPDQMFDRGITELGGMENFVRRGDKVVIKPNMSWFAEPSLAANTNPLLVKRIVEHCFNAGAKKVYIFDNILARDSYRESGIERAARDAGADVVPANLERYYQAVSLPKAKRLKTVKVHELLLEADSFINVPVLKHHGSTHLTLGMKNLMGCVWDRSFYHRNNLDQCIADFLTFKKPTLNVIDAYRVMKNGGPGGRGSSEILLKKMQILSTDIVAADAAAAAQGELWGIQGAGNVKYIDYARELGVGTSDLQRLSVKKIVL